MTVPGTTVARCSLLSRLSYRSVDDDEMLMPFNRIRKIPGSENELHEISSQAIQEETRQLLEVDAVEITLMDVRYAILLRDTRYVQLHNLESGGSGNRLTVHRNITSI